jgi:fibronectin type 3 domain-containing protein
MQPAYCFCTKTRYNGSVKTCRTTQKRKGKIKLKKRLLSILLTALLLCAVLLVLVDTAWAAETLDCTVGVAAGKINPAYTGYVNRAMRYYIRNVSALSNVPDGQSILFFFEGVSAVASPNYKADDYTQSAVRNAAVCLAVKFVNGTPEIYYCEDQCSTFPDMPLEFSYKGNGYSPSTIYDGIYKVRLDNHLSGSKEDYAALTLDMSNNYLTGAKTNAFYLCDNDKRGTGKPFTNSQITSGNRSYQIHGHAGKTATQSNSFRWSVGCILAGATYGEFSALMAGITGDSSLSSAGKPPLLSEGQKRDFGYVVIDRSQYTTQLQEVYTGSGSYTKNGTTAYYNITSADARDAIHELCRGSLGIDFGGGTTGDVIDSGNCGANSSNVTWKLTSDGTLTISGTGKMADYGWEETPWYGLRLQVKKAIIKNGVTSIGSYAFCWCENLTSVTIPNSVTSIGDNAFYWCTSLTSVTIPYGVKDIGAYAFGFCKELSSVTIPSSVTTIGSSAFSNCTSLTSVTIPDGVTTISESAFESCSSLTSVTIPNSVTSIGDGAFWCCTNLTSVTIPRSVTSIGSGAFQYCSSLTSVTIPNSVTSIGGGAFGGSGLTSVTIPDTVTVIGDGVFRGCSRLSGVTIPDSVTSIGSFAFSFCDSLTNVTIPKSMTRISENAFCACLNMTDVYYAGTASDWAKITIEEGNEPLTSATLHCAKSAPTAPVVKLGNSATSGKPMLTWNAVYGATSYRIYRSTSRGSGYSLLGTTTATSYTNTGAKAGTTYYYKVKAVNSAGESAYSNIVSGRATVTTLTMGHSSTSGKPQLTWKAVSGAVSYKVYRATAKNGAYTVINTTKALTYTNVGAALGTTYYYKVEALNAAGKSLGFSAVVEGKVAPVLAVGYSSVSGKPQLTWKAVPGATEYQVYRSTQQNSGYSKINTTTSTSYVNTGAKAGTTYYYRIVAVKGTAASDFSNIVSARPSK